MPNKMRIDLSNRTVVITAKAEAEAAADEAVVHIGFGFHGKDRERLYAEASAVSNAIVDALTSAGVASDAIESRSQSLEPIEPNGDANKTLWAAGSRFKLTQSWTARVPAERAADVLHLAIEAGANDSGQITWELRDEDALQAEAAGLALEKARAIAQRMARGLGAQLGPLIHASNEVPSSSPYPPAPAGMVRARKAASPLAIRAQRIRQTATVYAVFSIE